MFPLVYSSKHHKVKTASERLGGGGGEGGGGGRGQLGNVRTRNHGRENTCTLYFSWPVQLSPDTFEDGCALEKKK